MFAYAAKSPRVAPSGATRRTVRRAVDPNYVVNEPYPRHGLDSPIRIFFARNGDAIPAAEAPKIDAFKVAPKQSVDLTLLGLATEDEIAADPTLPQRRAEAVNLELGSPRPAPPHGRHSGTRSLVPGTSANTQNSPDLRFNRAVEILQPDETSLSPSTPSAPAGPCEPGIEASLQDARNLAVEWIEATRTELRARPVAGSIAASLHRFFGNPAAPTARRVEHNLGLIRAEITRLSQPAHHHCADPHLPACVGAIAFNDGDLTLCSRYSERGREDRARNLVHEAGHSTFGLRVTGLRNARLAEDFAYRRERLIFTLGEVSPDRSLANSDSYAMFLMTRRAPAAVNPDLHLPVTDPAATGFASGGDAHRVARSLAAAEIWVRLARHGLNDLHSSLRMAGIGSSVPAGFGDPRRLDRLLFEVKQRFPPILSAPGVRGDDLLMIAGVRDRYDELQRFLDRPIATSAAADTELTIPPHGPLALAVSPAFLAASELARTRIVIEKLVAHIGTTRIGVAMRAAYVAFAEAVRDLYQ